MKRKIILIIYIVISLVILVSSFMPYSTSKKQSDKVGSTVGNIFNIFFDDKIIDPTDITYSKVKEEYYVGDTLDLKANVFPLDSTYSSLTYSSSDVNIAKVSSHGIINFLKEGNVIITIKQSDSNLEKTINFKVSKKVLENIDFIDSMKKGESQVLIFTPLVTEEIIYSSSDTDILLVEKGIVYAKNVGSAIITIKIGEIVKNIEIEVISNEVIELEKIEIIKENINVLETKKLEVKTTPTNATFRNFIWESLNEEIVSVDSNGNITCKKRGKATIRAYDFTGIVAEIEIDAKNILPVFDFDTLSTRVGKSNRINPTNKPTYSICSYSSSDETIAKVGTDGVITAKKVGKTFIHIVCDDGFESIEKDIEIIVDEQIIYDKVSNFNYIMRKILGHFMGFALLGVFAFLTYYLWLKKKLAIIICLSSGLFMGIITEIIQLFVEGRSGSVADVLIDYGGFLLGAGITCLIIFILNKRKMR